MKKITTEEYQQIADKLAPKIGSLSFGITKVSVAGALIINSGNGCFANSEALKLIGVSISKKGIKTV